MAGTKRVVSISLGSSTRDAYIETEILGQRIVLERRGTDGDLDRAAAAIRKLDGKVDAIGLGGTDLYVVAGDRRYYVRDSVRLARNAKSTPVVCGAGLKDSLERKVVRGLDRDLGWRGKRVLMLSAVDRYGMAETLAAAGAELLCGDLVFLLGLPVPLRSLGAVALTAKLLAPIVTKLPIRWIYPTGSSQEAGVSGWRTRYFERAEVIAGDFHLLKRYGPEELTGKVVLTNTTTAEDVELLRRRGVGRLITTTPRFEGRSLSTNLLEAAFIAVAGKLDRGPKAYLDLLERSGLEPDILDLND